MGVTISSSAEDVQTALHDLEAVYYSQCVVIDKEAKQQKKELLAYRIERRRALRRLLDVVKTNPPVKAEAKAAGD